MPHTSPPRPGHERRVGPAASRRRRSLPVAEVLEGRALMAATSLDTAFGSSGYVLGPISHDVTSQTAPTTISAVAVQPDGKVVEVGLYNKDLVANNMAILRYNADGTPDTSFGTNGQLNITLPAGATAIRSTAPHVLIKTDGSIDVAATFETQSQFYDGLSEPSLAAVYQFTPSGQLDPAFGVGGVVLDSAPYVNFTDLALEGDKVVVLATQLGDQVSTSSTIDYYNHTHLLALIRLTSTGALDSTFNGTGVATVALPADQEGTRSIPYEYKAIGLALAPSGQVYVEGQTNITDSGGPYTSLTNDLSRFNADGTLDTSFGTAGTMVVPGTAGNGPTQGIIVSELAVQPDNKLIVVGGDYIQGTPFLERLDVDGAVDATFLGAASLVPGSGIGSVVIAPDGGIALDGSFHNYLLAQRLLATGAPDPTFGVGGRATLLIASPFTVPTGTSSYYSTGATALALNSSNELVVAGYANYSGFSNGFNQQTVTTVLRPVAVTPVANDFDGDGKSDLAVYLPVIGKYAIRPSDGAPDILVNAGIGGAGQTIPGAGLSKGAGLTVASPLTFVTAPALLQVTATVPAFRVPTTTTQIGAAGAGNSIPADADYDGDGNIDPAVYLPQSAVLAYRPSSGGPDVLQSFGAVGTDASIPAPGDYDGDGKADLAVYLPASGVFAYRPSSGGPDVLTSFGAVGPNASIPVPGDYDGDGKTDLAVYMPQYGVLAYRPSSGGPDVLAPFGAAGAGASIPAPGDYDGDGKTDLAVYLPQYGVFAYRPSSGGTDVLQTFGAPGAGNTIPVASIPYANEPVVGASSLRVAPGSSAATIPLALTDADLDSIAGILAANAKKKAATHPA